MRTITFSKKKIRIATIGSACVVAAAAVGTAVVLSSMNSKAAERQLPVYSVERPDKKIAVTFDVAWENSNTGELIEILDEFDAKATFFVTGDFCDRHPEDVKLFFDAGHEIANHSDTHPHIKGINVNTLISDTREASRKISMITGKEPTLYRAPYGEYSDTAITTLRGMGLQVIQWDVDSVDWDKTKPADMIKRVTKDVGAGSIILFHNDLANTTEALPQILTKLKEEGYEFVTVSELVYKDNYRINSEGRQIPDEKSSINLTDEQIQAVIAQNPDILDGFTDEEIAAAVAAIKGGNIGALPAEIQQVISSISSDGATSSAPAPSESAPAASESTPSRPGAVEK